MTLDQVDLPASQPNTINFPSGHQTLNMSCQKYREYADGAS